MVPVLQGPARITHLRHDPRLQKHYLRSSWI